MSQPSPPPGDLPSDLVPPLQPFGSSPLVPSGSFRVDQAEAPRAIEDLQSALAELQEIKRLAGALGRVTSTSNDSVSVDAAKALSAVAAGGPGSLAAAVDESINQLNGLIEALTADLASYRGNEATTTRSFSDGLRP